MATLRLTQQTWVDQDPVLAICFAAFTQGLLLMAMPPEIPSLVVFISSISWVDQYLFWVSPCETKHFHGGTPMC